MRFQEVFKSISSWFWGEPDPLATASKLLDRELYDAAESATIRVLKDHPEHPRAIAMLGQIYFARERYEDAIEYYLRADPLLEDRENRAELRYMLGISYSMIDRHEEALESFLYGIRQIEDLAHRRMWDLLNSSAALEFFALLQMDSSRRGPATGSLAEARSFLEDAKQRRAQATKKAHLIAIMEESWKAYKILGSGPGFELERGRCLSHLGFGLMNFGYDEPAITVCRKALDLLARTADSTFIQADCRETIGTAYQHLGDEEKAKEWRLGAIDQFLEAGPKQWRKEALRELSNKNNA